MKIIVSHDVDHWYLNDHFFKDWYLQKFMVRNSWYLLNGSLTFRNYLKRLSLLKSNRMERLKEVLDFDEQHGIPASCFVGFGNALNLSYSTPVAASIIKYLTERGVKNYPHGIAYDQESLMMKERDRYLEVRNGSASAYGIRMHYLRNNESTRPLLNKLGYCFSSNEYALKDPYFIQNIWEFPVSMMDVYEISYGDNDPKKAIEKSKRRIMEARAQGLEYFTLIFHDHHYADAFWQFREWYQQIIQFLYNHFEFTSFETTLNKLTNGRN